jgi:hypothetical protein
MKELLDLILEKAKSNLEKDGELLPVGFTVKDGKVTQVMPLTRPSPEGCPLDDKGYNVFLLGAMAGMLNADHVVMLWDAAFKTLPEGTDIDKLDEYERPLLYPKSMRTECVILSSVSVPDGDEDLRIVPYSGGDGEPVKWLPEKLPSGVNAESRFTEIARKGYASAGMFEQSRG